MCMNLSSARLLAGMIGEVIEVPIENKECWGKFLHVKVGIDVSKPLKRGIRVYLEEFDTLIVAPIRYERLPEYCYGCGEIGHPLRDCPCEEIRVSVMAGGEAKYWSWLNVMAPVRIRGYKQRGEDFVKRNFGFSRTGEAVVESEKLGVVIVNKRKELGGQLLREKLGGKVQKEISAVGTFQNVQVGQSLQEDGQRSVDSRAIGDAMVGVKVDVEASGEENYTEALKVD
ncbi:hypothetical protein ACOSQ2_033166 [Xanthoceras sorbifolium]